MLPLSMSSHFAKLIVVSLYADGCIAMYNAAVVHTLHAAERHISIVRSRCGAIPIVAVASQCEQTVHIRNDLLVNLFKETVGYVHTSAAENFSLFQPLLILARVLLGYVYDTRFC